MSVPPPAPAPHVSQGFSWWSPFAALLVAYAAALVFVAILAGATGNTGEGDLPSGILLGATFIQDTLLVLAMVGFAHLSGVRPTAGAFGVRKVDFRRAIGPAALAFVVFWAFLQLWSQLDSEATDDLAADLGAKESDLALIAVVLLVCLVAPVVEELFFRGFLFGAMRRAMHWIPAAMISGLVFGGVHAGGTPAVFLVPLMVFGFVLCALYRRTGSLVPSMGLHALNNGIALGVTMWGVGEGLLTGVIAATVVTLGASAVAE